MQRTVGVVEIDFAAHGDTGTRLERLFQQGAGRARFPRAAYGAAPEAVLINTAGGLTGGDRFDTAVRVGPGATAVVTTQASEKIYRASSGDVVVRNVVRVQSGGHVEWLPQETIVFDAARLDRTLDVTLAPDTTALMVEAVVLGRTAMGESVRTGWLRDRWRVRVGDQLVYADALALDGVVSDRLQHPVGLAGGCATATVLSVGPEAGGSLEAVRATLDASVQGFDASGPPLPASAGWVEGGASAWNGLLAVRIAASDGASLRRALEPVLSTLRPGRTLPTVWHC